MPPPLGRRLNTYKYLEMNLDGSHPSLRESSLAIFFRGGGVTIVVAGKRCRMGVGRGDKFYDCQTIYRGLKKTADKESLYLEK